MKGRRDTYPEMILYPEVQAIQNDFELSNETLLVLMCLYNLTSQGTTPGLKDGIRKSIFKGMLKQHQDVLDADFNGRVSFDKDIAPHLALLASKGLLRRRNDILLQNRHYKSKPIVNQDYEVTDFALECIREKRDTYLKEIEVVTQGNPLF